ncbi:MAG: hypothetical protein HWD58_09620 [Bacteroidota bacterium]|nr:MAG: hypothetical protein HWD58_09620 [Bacteroidota bacterium]
MTEVQHIHNDQHWHTSFSSNAQNPSVHAEPSVYSAVQTLGAKCDASRCGEVAVNTWIKMINLELGTSISDDL